MDYELDVDLALAAAVLEVESHHSKTGWDQPARLYALVDTAHIVEHEPALAAQLGLDVDIEAPDRVSGSGDRVTARYHLEAPDVPVADPDRTWFQEVVTERDDDGVWRVASANECQQWTIA